MVTWSESILGAAWALAAPSSGTPPGPSCEAA